MIRVFPRRTKWTPTDELAFVGMPPLFRPEDQPVRISVTFTWDIPFGQILLNQWSQYYTDVQIGGVAFGDPGGEFIPGRFIKNDVTITSRGCIKKCGWCFVPKREGKIREIEIKDGHIIQDNNLLACSRKHIEAVFDMLRQQKKPAEFKGGLDVTLLQDWHRELFNTIRIKEIWVACDTKGGLNWLKKASKILDGISRYKKYCFVMIGYKNETFKEAETRLEQVYNLGFRPFSQLYQSEVHRNYPKEWRKLNCTWSRPAAYEAMMKNNKKKQIYMKQIQFINWFPSWRGFKIKRTTTMIDINISYFLIYKWFVLIGFWEIRKFMTKSERKKALKIYNQRGTN